MRALSQTFNVAIAPFLLAGALAMFSLTRMNHSTLLAGGGLPDVEAHTADDTLTAAESGSVHTNTGAAGAIALTLPAATVGLRFRFYVGAAQELRINPDGTETISLPSTGVAGAAGKYLTANAVGETVELACCQAGTWAVFGFTGTWTAEA